MTVDYAAYLSSDLLARGSQNLMFDANRNTAFIGGSLGMGAATLGAELGSVFGGKTPPMINAFGDGSTTPARGYLTFGVRLPVGRAANGK